MKPTPPKLLDPPYTLEERIEFISNPTRREVAKSLYHAMMFLYDSAVKALSLPASAFFSLYQLPTKRLLLPPPDYALSVFQTIPKPPTPETARDSAKTLIEKLIRSSRMSPLTTGEMKEIEKALDGSLTEKEEQALAEKHFQKEDYQKTLIDLIKRGKVQTTDRREVLNALKRSLKTLSEETILACTAADSSEGAFLEARKMQILKECPALDQGAILWKKCTSNINEEEKKAVEGAIEKFYREYDQENLAESYHAFLKLEYAALLEQKLSQNVDLQTWNNTYKELNPLNQTIQSSFKELYQALEIPRPPESYSFEVLEQKLNELGPDSPLVLNFYASAAEILSALNHHAGAPLLKIQDKTSKDEKRKKTVIHHLFLAFLKQTPSGQQLVKAMELSPTSEAEWQLKEEATKAFHVLFAAKSPLLEGEIYTKHELAIRLTGQPENGQNQAWRLDTKTLTQELSFSFADWHSAAQKVWINHLSLEEEMELRALSTKERESRMAALFSQWILTKAKLPFTTQLSFSHLSLPNRAEEREKALKTLRTWAQKPNSKFQAFKANVQAKRQAAAEKAPFLGAPLQVVQGAKVIQKAQSKIRVNYVDLDNGFENQLLPPSGILSQLKQELPYDPKETIENRIAWIKTALANLIYQKYSEGATLLYSAFFDIAKSIKTYDANLLEAFTSYVQNDRNAPLEKSNEWRKTLLCCFLQLRLAGAKNPLDVSATERDYLTQMATLAEFFLPSLNVANGTLTNTNTQAFGEALQQSSTELEGLEESRIQLSFQNSQALKDTQTRARIDALRSRNGRKVPKEHLEDVLAAYSLETDQGQQAIARAVTYAFRDDAEKGAEWVQGKLKTASDKYNENTLALPANTFWSDLLLTFTEDEAALKTVRIFNDARIRSNNAPQMLQGLAREIVRLTKAFEKDEKNQNFHDLLRVKIAYQLLKKQAFKDKVRLEGFLHLAASEADNAIVTSFHAVKAFALLKTPQDVIDACYPDQKLPPEQKTYVDKGIEKVFKNHQEYKKAVYFTPPAFFTFGKHDLDIASGMVYYEGEEQQELPADFQNNPYVRSLKLHELPYVPSHNGSYIHSTEKKGKRVPQIRLSSRFGDQVIIERRLNIAVNGNARMKMLQYCPLENIQSIPSAVSERMGIREYWIDTQEKILCGYDENETLVASISLNNQKITTARNTFHLPNDDEQFRAVQSYLETVLPIEEVLINDVRNEVWIPSLDMTLTLGRNKEWSVNSPHVSGLIIDFNNRIPGTFVFKEDKTVQADELLEGEIRVFELRLKKCEAKTTPSLKEKEEKELIKNRLQELKIKRAQREKRCYLTLLPSEQSPAKIRQTITTKTNDLLGFVKKMQGSQNPKERQNLQKGFLEGEKELAALKRDYYKTCSKQEVTFAETFSEGCVKGRDLADTLFLLLQSSTHKIAIDPIQWIDELSLHGENKTLNDKTFNLLYKCAQIKQLPESLNLYLHLLLCHHHFLMLDDIAKTESRDKEERLKGAKDQYGTLKRACTDLQQECKKELPSPVNALLAIHSNAFRQQQQIAKAFPPPHTISPHAAQHLQGLAEQSLLERLSLAPHTTPTHKNADVDIEGEQNALVKAFKKESNEQVSGFYLEEFGLFSTQALYQEFSLQGDQALFGLKKKDIDALFRALIEKKWIAQRTKTSIYYSLTEKTHHPLTCGQTADLMALLAPLPVSPENRKEIARRLKTFFFKGAHASFSYAWKDEASKQASRMALLKEGERCRKEMLEAQNFLTQFLALNKTSLTAFKRKVLLQRCTKEEMGGYNALIRYLFHQSELKHIDNILSAPQIGERNQIELLSTARQYSIDLLLREVKTKTEKEDKIIQLAFLLFEEDYGARCNPMQVKLFSSLMRSQTRAGAIDAMQARMGFGKTALLPLLAIVQLAKEGPKKPEDKSLVRYIVPKAVLQDNATSFNERISHILGSNVIQDREFSRYQIDPLNKAASFKSVKEDLQKRLAFYEYARANGIVLIQFPEIRQSMEAQEEAFGFLAVNQALLPNEIKLCLECKQLLGKIRSMKTYTVFDELDATQDFKACEVNFTEGQRIPIDQESIVPLNRCIDLITKNRTLQRASLAQLLLNGIGLDEGEQKTVTFFVTNQDQTIGQIDGLKDLLENLQKNNSQAYATIFLIRALLFDDNMLEFVRSKEPSTHFGVRFSLQGGKRIYSYDPHTQSALLIAVPYEGTNTPKGLSNFDNTEVAAIATLRFYSSLETPLEKEPHLDFLIKQTQKDKLPPFLERFVENVQDQEKRTFVQRLKHLSQLLDPAEIQQAKQLFYQDFLREPKPEVRTYFGMAVVATQVHSDEARANSNRYEMGSPDDEIRGCSGTVGSTSSYFEKPANDPAADGKLSLEIMGRKENEEIKKLPEHQNGDYLTFILKSLLLTCAKDNTRAIIDAAGLCKSRDGLPETIVEKLWELLKQDERFRDIEGIVYYGKDNVKRLYRGPGLPPIRCTTAMELEACKGKKYFSFYGQKNTRGSDIKQPEGAHALVTMDENVPNSDAKQAVLRFRGLVQRAFKQTFTFALTPRFYTLLLLKNNNRGVTGKDVALDLRKREKEQEERDALLLFRKELQAHVKQGAAHMEHVLFSTANLSNSDVQKTYKTFLEERNKIVPLVEKSLTQLDQKYGGSLQKMGRDAFITEETKRYQEKLKDLDDLAKKTAEALKIDRPPLQKEFFEARITKSTELFKSRYPKELPVRIAAVDTGAEAVALALAEAQAEALAEVVAEVLTHTAIHSTPRLPNLGITMTQEKPFTPSQDWFANPAGQALDTVEEMKHLIHPKLREEILISPHLQAQQIVSQYALSPHNDKTHHPIFVSYEEAERWMTLPQEAKNQSYQLIDLREKLDPNASLLLQNMQVAVLREVEKLPEPKSTDELKQINLIHAESRQLLPHLTLTGSDQKSVAEHVDLTSFGVSKSGKATLTLENTDQTFTVTGQDIPITVHKQNKWLAPIFLSLKDSNKFETLKTTFEKKFAAVKQQITDLKQERAALDVKKQDLANVISNVSSFTITNDLKEGLLERDADFHINMGKSIFHKRMGSHIAQCGQAFFNKIKEIQSTQKACADTPTKENFKKLQDVFASFISDKMRIFKGDSTKEAVFDEPYWTKNHQTLPPFDLVYGRILYEVHDNSTTSAARCARQDCQQIFNVTIPALRKTIESMDKAMTQITLIEADINDLQQKLDKLMQETASLEEAENCLNEMEQKGTALVNAFSKQGIELVNQGEATTLFWDRFPLENIADLSQNQVKVTMETTLPTYSKTIENMVTYQRRIHALNSTEVTAWENQKNLWSKTLELSKQVEKREDQMTWLA